MRASDFGLVVMTSSCDIRGMHLRATKGAPLAHATGEGEQHLGRLWATGGGACEGDRATGKAGSLHSDTMLGLA